MTKKVAAPKLLTVAAVEKEISAISNAVGGIGQRLHACAVQCLMHATPPDMGGTGDARLMDKLIQSLTIGADGRGRRKAVVHVEGIIAWCTAFSPIRWNGDGKVKVLSKESKDYKWDVAKAIKTPFWEVAGQQAVQPFTIETMLKVMYGMTARLKKAVENDRFQGDQAKAEKVASTAEATAKRLAKELGVDLNSQGGNAAANPGNTREASEKPGKTTRRKVVAGASKSEGKVAA